MSDAAIHCRSLSKRFGTVRAVHDVDLDLRPGRILALLGPSGCGKTTVLRLIAGFEVPDAGLIAIGGSVVFSSGSFVPPEKRKVGMVFQDYALFPHLDVARNVAYGLATGKGRDARVKEVLSLVGMADLARRMPHELSGGQQQRVALARALAPRPDVILLDEPFSSLDAGLRAKVRTEVRDILHAAGATAVFVTHDQEEALSLADEVGVMFDGRIVQVASPSELYDRPATREVASFVGDADFLPGQACDGTVACELGILRSARALGGAVDVMLRPENLDLAVANDGPFEITHGEFFGHDHLFSVRLPSGRTVRSRLGPHAGLAVGDRVLVSVRDAVNVFAGPRDTSN